MPRLSPLDRLNLVSQLKQAHQLATHQSNESIEGYLNHVVIDSRPEPRAFRLVAENWQWTLARRVGRALESVAGIRSGYTGPRFFWLTLPRGHDKTSFIGRLLNWALAFCKRPIHANAAAGDKDQADYLAQFMRSESALNPWLKKRINYQNYKVLGQNESRLWIMAADAMSSFGNKSDLVVCDEMTHWDDGELFHALMSGSEKRPDMVFVVITNAGLLGSWQHEAMLRFKKDPAGYVYESPGPIAGWMNRQRIEELAKSLPKGLAQRVLFNQWQDPSEGCGYITRAEAASCVELGRTLALAPMFQGKPGVQYYAAIDYGSVKDRTVMVVVHREKDLIIVDRMDVIQGSPTARVSLDAVETWMREINKAFNGPWFLIDQYQMEHTLQNLQYEMRLERFEPRGGKANYEMAVNLHNTVISKKLAWYPGCGDIYVDGKLHTLIDEISELVVKSMVYGYRFDHQSGKHDDRVVALAMCCLLATQKGGQFRQYVDSDYFF